VSTGDLLALMLVLSAPVTLALVVAMIRGYSISLTLSRRRPTRRRGRARDGNGDGA
jgi:hypothetical protein